MRRCSERLGEATDLLIDGPQSDSAVVAAAEEALRVSGREVHAPHPLRVLGEAGDLQHSGMRRSTSDAAETRKGPH